MSKNKEYTEQVIDPLTPILEEPQFSLLGKILTDKIDFERKD